MDPQALALAKAIARAETGNMKDPYNAKGASGETGRYQFMPATWNEWSTKYLGQPNAPMTVENQNKVAYSRIKELKDQGLTPAQIASSWNSGNPNAYKEGKVGTNSQGVDYNVPAYVEKVSKFYKELAPKAEAETPERPESPALREKKPGFLQSTGPSFPANQGGSEGIAGNLLRTIGNIPSSARDLARFAAGPVNPFDLDNPMNIGANLSKIPGAISDIRQNRKAINEAQDNKRSIPDMLRQNIGLNTSFLPKRDTVAGDIAGGVTDTLGKGVDILKAGTGFVSNKIKQEGLLPTLAQGANVVAKLGIEDPLLIPSIIYAPSKIRGTGVTTDTISQTSKAVSKVFEPTTAKLEKTVVDQFQKGVKPRINMNMTPGQAQKFDQSIVKAAQVIDENKSALKFVDDLGEEFVGRNPKTLGELSDALEQTKKTVFNKYDALTTEAGDQGLKIKLNPIAKELDTVIANEALQISNPNAIRYAYELQERLSYRELNARVTQDLIANYNESLKAFYRNPTYDTASQASIDAMVANQLRKQLDEGITGLTGVQYQDFKNQYAALKAVERDIIKAALRDARKNNKSLLDYTDILTGGDLVTGLITMNPAQLARGSVSRGIKEWYKYLNSPNRAVEKMFKATEKLNQRSIPKSQATKSPSASGANRLSNQPSTSIPITPAKTAIPKVSPITDKDAIRVLPNSGVKINPKVEGEVIIALKKNENFPQAMAELEALTEIAEAGSRNMTGYGADKVVKANASTFPKWIPADLRSKKLMEKTLDHITEGTLPAKNATKEQRLYEEFVDYIRQRVTSPEEMSLMKTAESTGVFGKIKKFLGEDIPNKQGGFVRIGKAEKKVVPSKSKVNESVSLPKSSTKLPEETIKYKPKKDLVIKDVTGAKVTIPAGTIVKAGQGKGSNTIIGVKDNVYTINKGQFDNLKGQSVSGEARVFAPELKGTEEVVKGGKPILKQSRAGAKKELDDMGYTFEKDMSGDGYWVNRAGDFVEYDDVSPKIQRLMDRYIGNAEKFDDIAPLPTKYSNYQLPDGKNYKEILITVPEALKKGEYGPVLDKSKTFRSSHWDEPNVISHLRMNERTYNGKKVSFMEELQSDWAREARAGKDIPQNPMLKNWQTPTIKRALKEAVDNDAQYFAWINGDQTSARYNLATHVDNVKWGQSGTTRGKKIYVNAKEGRDIIIRTDETGAITKGRSIPADWAGKKLDEVLGKGLADKIMEKPAGTLKGDGLKFGGEWANNLYDKQVKNIVEDLTGAKAFKMDLGLPVSKTKDNVEIVVGSSQRKATNKDIRVGAEINNGENNFIITEVIDDGKFRAVPKDVFEKADEIVGMKMQRNSDPNFNFTVENVPGVFDKTQTFDISTPKTIQQGIKLTPEIKAIIRGESPLKNEGKVRLGALPLLALPPLIFALLMNKEE